MGQLRSTKDNAFQGGEEALMNLEGVQSSQCKTPHPLPPIDSDQVYHTCQGKMEENVQR